MSRAEIERGCLLRLARRKNTPFESEKERNGESGQSGFLVAPAALRSKKDFRRTESRRFSRRAKISILLDEEAGFNGDSTETLCAADDRFKTQFRIFSESIEGNGRGAFRQRTTDRWRYYLFAIAKRAMVLFSDVSGQIHTPDTRLAGLRANDGAARH